MDEKIKLFEDKFKNKKKVKVQDKGNNVMAFNQIQGALEELT